MNWSELAEHAVKVYHTPWCPDCRRLEQRFEDNGISFTTIDIDSDSTAADALVEKTGHRAIPYVEIDDRCIIRGWHKDLPGRWSDDTFFKEIEEGLGA